MASAAQPPTVQTVRIAMSDGVRLATDIYLPHGDGPFPVVLSRTPYSRVGHKEGAANFAADGYVCVVQDRRGRFDSEGETLPFVGCGWAEHQDGVDTVEWIKKQQWCNGRIATIGGSAGGITQNLLAAAVPAGLKAQYISVAAVSLYGDASYIGGAFRKADTENRTTGNKFDPRALEIIHAHPNYDDYWRRFDTSLKFTQMNVPAVHIGRWFDHYLRGVDNGVEREPAVAYYVMGDTSRPGAPGNEWRHADDWPVPAHETAAYFARDGKLTWEKPATASAPPSHRATIRAST
jgi:predicted acyl esterase